MKMMTKVTILAKIKSNISLELLRSSLTVQTALLVLASFAFFILSYGISFNIVMYNYYLGGISFLDGQNPYEVTLRNGPSNQFKYSPLFALIMGGMARFSRQDMVVGLWLLVGMTAYSFGLSRWSSLARIAPFYVPLALFAGLIELTVSLSVNQSNALIIGLILIGLAEYRDGRHFSAGAILLLATNFKVYPVIFLASLALLLNPAYLYGALSMGLATFLLPACFVGWSHNWNTHLAWFYTILRDSSGPGILNMLSAFQRNGLTGIGQIMHWLVLVISIPLFFSYVRLTRRVDWRPWMAFGIASLLLLSPRTEVFTYVLLAPSYVLMAIWCAESEQRIVRTYGGVTFAIFAVLIASMRYVDPQWYVSESPMEIVRVIGALGFWIFSGLIVASTIYPSKKAIARHIDNDNIDDTQPSSLRPQQAKRFEEAARAEASRHNP